MSLNISQYVNRSEASACAVDFDVLSTFKGRWQSAKLGAAHDQNDQQPRHSGPPKDSLLAMNSIETDLRKHSLTNRVVRGVR